MNTCFHAAWLALLIVFTPRAGAQGVAYAVVGQPWDAALGTHRAVLHVAEPAAAVRAHLEWRRRDRFPEKKGVIVVDARTRQRVMNTVAITVGAEAGDIVFEPAGGAGDYFAYFLPGNPGSGSFPEAKYLPPQETAAADWKTRTGVAAEGWRQLPEAQIARWEARTEHDRFTEMEIIATQAERSAWLAAHPEAFAVFIEPAERPVRMFDQPPQRWLLPHAAEEPSCGPGEPLVFQVAVWAARSALNHVQVRFGEFKAESGGPSVPGGEMKCLQLEGKDVNGQPYEGRVDVPAGHVIPLWCGGRWSAKAPGRYAGTAEVSAEGLPPQRIPFTVKVSDPGNEASAYADPHRLAKLLWLNSTWGQDDELTRPFTPLRVEGRTIRCLGRSVTLGESGLPESIGSFFNGSVTRIIPDGRPLLAAPMRFVVTAADGTEAPLSARGFRFAKSDPGAVEWDAGLAGAGMAFAVHGRMEFDGHLELRCESTVEKALGVQDIRLEIPRTQETAKYALGLGLYGGLRPETMDWKWDVVKKDQDALWLGDVNAGLRVQLRAENYRRPMVNIHYPRQPLNDPPSWSNGGEGGITVVPEAKTVLCTAHSGARTLEPGQPLHFDFDLSVTPFKPLNTEAQWHDRYYQAGGMPAAPEKIREMGANVVNIHQGNALNPYINYPFLTADKLREYTARAHAAGLRVKDYYTVRELTNWTPELFALRSFGDELIAPGQGGGHAWCEEHLGGDYWGAWYEPGVNDASILTTTMSRFHNFYIEGLRSLVANTGCDGIYLDDISYDRTVMKRARKILDADPRGGLIDLHSWNEMNGRAGFASCSLIFMDSFPYVDRLWLGEGHHYDGPPEQTLVAVSGIPFGLMGEMLEGGGNPWLGLTFGMTGRLGWGGSPQAVWKLWDDFGVGSGDSEFIGWWDAASPVKATAPECRATIWRKSGKTLVAVGNFSDKPARTALAIDFPALGLEPKTAHLYAPEMKGFQPELLFAPEAAISIAPKRGFAFILDATPRQPVRPAAAMAFDPAKLLFEDTFLPHPKDGWKTIASKKIESIKPDAAGLVFLAPANVHAWAERALPPDAALVAAQIRQDAGDGAQQWGPGVALAWPDGRILKANCRKDGRFGLSVNGEERLVGMCEAGSPVAIAFAIGKDAIRITVGGEGVYQQEQELARLPRSEFPGAPASVRVGKMPNSGQPQDHADAGAMGWSRCDWLRVYR